MYCICIVNILNIQFIFQNIFNVLYVLCIYICICKNPQCFDKREKENLDK